MHVLVVDDSVELTEMFQAVLEGHGYRISVAHDGVQALDVDARDPADAVLTDLSMPRMNGDELLRRLRERRPALPAIILTGYAGRLDLADARTTVLDKPIRMAELVRRLAALMDTRTAGAPDGPG